MKKKRRRIRKGVLAGLIVFLLAFLFLIGYLLFNTNFHFIGKKSANEDAARFKTKTCLLFYPEKMDSSLVKELCQDNEEERIYDYTLSYDGDYALVDYGDDFYLVLDRDFKPVKVNTVSERGRQIISDRLRYEMKKEQPEVYYGMDFLEASYYPNIPVEEERFAVEKSDLIYHAREYSMDVVIPLSYIQEEIGIHLSIPKKEYVKEYYVDPEMPMIALTFDDGPYSPVCQDIIDVLYRYDGVATFFVVGNRLSENQLNFMRTSIERGNQYGSHTSDHINLRNVSNEEGAWQVTNTSDYVRDKLGYEMTVYRSPYGAHNGAVSQITGMRDILWKVDSLDWSSRNAESVKEIVYSETDENDVILFHELYPSTAEAIDDIVPYFVEKGYQLVTVDMLMEALNYDNDISVAFYGK